MTQPLGNRRPEAGVIPLVSFPFRRSVVAACAQNSAQWLPHSSKNTPRSLSRKRSDLRRRGSRAKRNQLTIKGGKYGNTNWIGCLGRHTETRQGHHETRERRIRRSLLIFITFRRGKGQESGRAHRRGGGGVLLNGAFGKSGKSRSSGEANQHDRDRETGNGRRGSKGHEI